MKNHWLKKRNSLDSLIARRFRSKEDANALGQKFIDLSEIIVDHLASKFDYCLASKDGLILDCVVMCYEKLFLYESNQNKCKAENYFTTVIQCFVRQIIRSYKRENLDRII